MQDKDYKHKHCIMQPFLTLRVYIGKDRGRPVVMAPQTLWPPLWLVHTGDKLSPRLNISVAALDLSADETVKILPFPFDFLSSCLGTKASETSPILH